MGDVLRLLALDGPVVGVGVLVALAWLIVRLESTRSENAAAHAAAHAAITRNIDAVKEELRRNIDGVKGELTKDIDGLKDQLTRDIDGLKDQLTKDIDSLKQDVRDVKQDVRMLTSHLLNRNSDDNG